MLTAHVWLKALTRDDWNENQILKVQLCRAYFISGELTFNQAVVISGEQLSNLSERRRSSSTAVFVSVGFLLTFLSLLMKLDAESQATPRSFLRAVRWRMKSKKFIFYVIEVTQHSLEQLGLLGLTLVSIMLTQTGFKMIPAFLNFPVFIRLS